MPGNDYAEINKRAHAKTEEAKIKRAEYDEEKAHLEEASRASALASAKLKSTAKTRSSLLKEKEEISARVEKTETRLVHVSLCLFPCRLQLNLEQT